MRPSHFSNSGHMDETDVVVMPKESALEDVKGELGDLVAAVVGGSRAGAWHPEAPRAHMTQVIRRWWCLLQTQGPLVFPMGLVSRGVILPALTCIFQRSKKRRV